MKLDPTVDGYTLTNDKGETISLSLEEVIGLTKASREILDQVQSRMPDGSKFAAVPTSPAKDIILSLDSHHSALVLRIVHVDQSETAYSIKAESVRSLRDALTRKIEAIEASQNSKTVQ